MLDWILNPTGTPYAAYVILWIILAVSIPAAFVWTLIKMWTRREKKDGLR